MKSIMNLLLTGNGRSQNVPILRNNRSCGFIAGRFNCQQEFSHEVILVK
jgi:hypothetical protein